MEYAFRHVQEAVEMIRTDDPLHRAFKAHLLKVAQAMHDIEWVESNDYGPGDDVKAIMACIDKSDVLDCAVEKAKEALAELHAVINSAEDRTP